MSTRFHSIARLTSIALAGFALLAASEMPGGSAADGPTAPEATALQATIVADTQILDTDEAHAPAVELDRPASLRNLVAEITKLPAPPLDAEAKCLTRAVFFEARGEPLEGQLAVAQVILNRSTSGKYPSSVCGVIDQPRQFTFARRAMNTGTSDYRIAQAIAVIAQAERWLQVAPRALSFHASHVAPGWGGMQRISRIGNHVFYR